MSYQALEKAFLLPALKISTLRKFRKEHLERLCAIHSVNVPKEGKKTVLKEVYVKALFNAVWVPPFNL